MKPRMFSSARKISSTVLCIILALFLIIIFPTAQSFGKTAKEVRAEDTPEGGNHPVGQLRIVVGHRDAPGELHRRLCAGFRVFDYIQSILKI